MFTLVNHKNDIESCVNIVRKKESNASNEMRLEDEDVTNLHFKACIFLRVKHLFSGCCDKR